MTHSPYPNGILSDPDTCSEVEKNASSPLRSGSPEVPEGFAAAPSRTAEANTEAVGHKPADQTVTPQLYSVTTRTFSPVAIEAVIAYLPSYFKDFIRFAYLTGWRKGEIAQLTWNDTDGKAKTIRLRPEGSQTKAEPLP